MKARYLFVGLALTVLWGSISCNKLGKSNNNNLDDGINPSGVADFRVTAYTDSSATLKWTAGGDDSTSGTADRYDLRYLKHTITSANWDSATHVTGLPHPSPSGQSDSMFVTGLQQDSTYYFSIMAYDEANNPSPRSGNVSVICFNNYIVTFPDTNLAAAIRVQLSLPYGSDIHRADILQLTSLGANDRNITYLDGLPQCTRLTGASFVGNHISNLGPLASMHQLIFLGLTFNNLTDISPISGLTNLTTLQLRTNHVADISALSNMNSLHLLDLTQNQVADIWPLVADTGFAAGDTVWCGENPLSAQSINTYIPQLQARGAAVIH
jgi:hypothetical protein